MKNDKDQTDTDDQARIAAQGAEWDRRNKLEREPLKGSVQGGEVVLRIPLELISELHLKDPNSLAVGGDSRNTIRVDGPLVALPPAEGVGRSRSVSLFVDLETFTQVIAAKIKQSVVVSRASGPR